MLTKRAQENALERETNRIYAGLTSAERDALTDREDKRKGVLGILTFQRNWLKHLHPEDFSAHLDPKQEARDLVERAIDNYDDLFDSLTTEMSRFRVQISQEYA